jgi:hypothetical protein
MSESTFPFGAPAESEPFTVEEEGGDNRKPLLLVSGLVGALVLGASAFLFLGGSDADDELALGVPPAVPPVAAAPAEPEAVAVIPAASTEQVGRNPFKARYIAPVEAPPPAEAPAVQAPPAPQPAPQPVQLTIQQAPAPAPAAEPEPAEYPLTLVSVSEPQPQARTITWKIDDKELEVLPGQRFGKYGELVVLAYSTNEDGTEILGVIIQVGDASPFDVQLGQTVNVL